MQQSPSTSQGTVATSGADSPSQHDVWRFVMDFSLCRVAKQLRLLGFDVVCNPAIRKEQILHLCAAEGRVVVTGSRHLVPCLERLRRLSARECVRTKARRVVAYNSDGESEYSSSDDEVGARGIQYILVKSTDVHHVTMRHIIQTLGLRWDPRKVFSRCVSCNLLIVAIEKSTAETHVHPTVFRVYSNFYQCPGCLKVYWGVDNGVIVNYKALRTIDYLRSYCHGVGGVIAMREGVGEGLQRHLMSYPRSVKTLIFRFCSADELAVVVEAFPMFRDLVGIVLSGASAKFVHSKKKIRGGNCSSGDDEG
jgi:uncharacterized protein with PIN domain